MEIQTNLTIICRLSSSSGANCREIFILLSDIHSVVWRKWVVLLAADFSARKSCADSHSIVGLFRPRLGSNVASVRSQSNLCVDLLWGWTVSRYLWIFSLFWVDWLVDVHSTGACHSAFHRCRDCRSFCWNAFPWRRSSWLRLNQVQTFRFQCLCLGQHFPVLFVGDKDFSQILWHQSEAAFIWLIHFLVSDAWKYFESPDEVSKFKPGGTASLRLLIGFCGSWLLRTKHDNFVNGFFRDDDRVNLERLAHLLEPTRAQLQHLVLLTAARVAWLSDLHLAWANFFGEHLKH